MSDQRPDNLSWYEPWLRKFLLQDVWTAEHIRNACRGPVSALVSAENPIPWSEWLPQRTELKRIEHGVQQWVTANCHYLVKADQVYTAHGFHGNNLFEALIAEELETQP